MSVELSVYPLAKTFTGRDVREAFADFATEAEGGLLLQFGADDTSFVRFECDHEDVTDSFTVERPCGDARLYEALYRFMTFHHAVLVSADLDPPVRVATESDFAVARVLAIPVAQIRVVHGADALLA